MLFSSLVEDPGMLVLDMAGRVVSNIIWGRAGRTFSWDELHRSISEEVGREAT